MRKDLKMSRGKEIAQGAHASIKFISDRLRKSTLIDTCFQLTLSKIEQDWIYGVFAKICLQVNSEAELLEIHNKAQEAGLISSIIEDSGKTVFHGVPTYTCLAIGPDESQKIDSITGHLKLY